MVEHPIIYWHADDYGMTESSNKRIEDCWQNGCLNSVSIVPNGNLREAVSHLRSTGLKLAVHLNLVEGRALSPASSVPLLTYPDGTFRHSFGGLLALSVSPQRENFSKQIKTELRAQLLAFAQCFPMGAPMRIDSHQHIHMIPLIFHILLQIIQEEHLIVEHLRIPAEPIIPFLQEPSLYLTYRPINFVKQVVLNGCWFCVRRKFVGSGIQSAVFCGILFSGHMDAERVSRVLPAFYRLAQKREQSLELLFHPGGIEEGETFFDSKKKEFHEFYRSPDRKVEAVALHTLNFKLRQEVKSHGDI